MKYVKISKGSYIYTFTDIEPPQGICNKLVEKKQVTSIALLDPGKKKY